MPGLNQLKQFSKDVLNLGNEEKVRAAMGEKPVIVPLPQGISEADDSQDFIDGMPENKDASNAAESNLESGNSEGRESDNSTILENQEATDNPSSLDSGVEPISAGDAFNDLLNGTTEDDELDLSAFNDSLGDNSNSDSKTDDSSSVKADDLSDWNLDDLLKSSNDDVSENAESEESNINSDNIPESIDNLETSAFEDNSANEERTDENVLDNDSSVSNSIDDIPIEDIPTEDILNTSENIASTTSDKVEGSPFEENEDVQNPTISELDNSATEAKDDSNNLDISNDIDDIPDMENVAGVDDVPGVDDIPSMDDVAGVDDIPSMEDVSGIDDIPSIDDIPTEDSGTNNSTNSLDIDPSEFDVEDFINNDENSSKDDSAIADTPIEDFDLDAMNGLDDSVFEEKNDFSSDGGSDFQLDDFNIPGYSDTDIASFGKKSPMFSSSDSKNNEETREKNTFTDAEYAQFRKNLSEYPLNLRLALEDMVVKNEFTDDAIFEILEKVLHKVPARQLAGTLEKLLDTTISVPRDFERRTVAQYEAYKNSAEYKLKNKILPGLIIGAIAAVLMVGIVIFTNKFIVTPIQASSLYKQGYIALENNDYTLSDEKFNAAASKKIKKNWFFKYAEGYRDHKQYKKAAEIYQLILNIFNHNKKAGMEYARMELDDYSNYEKAELVTRREILDYHINDKDGILLLGDIYLEWGTEKDPSKLELARQQYSELIQLYGSENLYMSRMMRYFVRTDNLYEVLQLKNRFFGDKKALAGEDWIELSGYMLDKLYGTIKPADAYLRESIEDVRALLECALKTAPAAPAAHYNMGRYFVNTENSKAARIEFENTLKVFENTQLKNKKDTNMYIDTYRLLGEQYINDREYIKAEEALGKGISFYEAQKHDNGFVGNSSTGVMYADMGDLDYFISGDMDNALRNYEESIKLNNDNPFIRYKSGYVHYAKKEYDDAMMSFIHAAEANGKPDDTHLLLALGNTFSLKGDNFAAQGYYNRLMERLENERIKHAILLPQVRDDQQDIVDTYMRGSNNLGVTEYRLAKQTGNSNYNAKAIVNMSISARAWDALTRNQVSMVRLEGSNLAVQNTKYITQPRPEYEPSIYTEIPKTLNGEKGFEE
ncbi:MAG: tetratricopeptide repeat protein [Treponema sp.]|nr:tetratricopeptide repeat protein [Treponema sp.]